MSPRITLWVWMILCHPRVPICVSPVFCHPRVPPLDLEDVFATKGPFFDLNIFYYQGSLLGFASFLLLKGPPLDLEDFLPELYNLSDSF